MNEKNRPIFMHVLKFSGMVEHVEVLIEYKSEGGSEFYYRMNRWAKDVNLGYYLKKDVSYAEEAIDCCTFLIEGDPQAIIKDWENHYQENYKGNQNRIHIIDNNCAKATQWCLEKFVGIPKPSLTYISINIATVGIFIPSFIPFPTLLPGRVMDNAKFYKAVSQYDLDAGHTLWRHYVGLLLSVILTTLASVLFIIVLIPNLPVSLSILCFIFVLLPGVVIGWKSKNALSLHKQAKYLQKGSLGLKCRREAISDRSDLSNLNVGFDKRLGMFKPKASASTSGNIATKAEDFKGVAGDIGVMDIKDLNSSTKGDIKEVGSKSSDYDLGS